MYEQISGNTLYLMFYAGVTVLNLIACCYLLFRRGNAIAPDVTSPLRLRRWTAMFLGACALSHLWYVPIIYLTSSEDIMMLYFVCAVFDFLTIFPLAIAVLFTMLQDRRRPLWPIALMMAPIAVGMMVCIVTHSDVFLSVLYAYYLLLIIGIIIYMVRETRQYGRWLRDNYADLEHKEVWQSMLVLATILLGFGLYVFELQGLFFKYAAQVNAILLTCFLVWRVETLSDLSFSANDTNEETAAMMHVEDNDNSLSMRNRSASPLGFAKNIGPLLKQHCEESQLYLQNDLSLTELAKQIGTNRLYLSQHFAMQGTTYNAYINSLRIQHFINLYHEVAVTHQPTTVQQLAYQSGFCNYGTFNRAFKQTIGMTATEWIRQNR